MAVTEEDLHGTELRSDGVAALERTLFRLELVNAIVTKTEASASDLLALSATLAATTAAARELLR